MNTRITQKLLESLVIEARKNPRRCMGDIVERQSLFAVFSCCHPCSFCAKIQDDDYHLSSLFLLTFFCLCSDAVGRVSFSDTASTSLLQTGTSRCISYYTGGNSSRIFVTAISENCFSTARYICLCMVVQIPWRVWSLPPSAILSLYAGYVLVVGTRVCLAGLFVIAKCQ